MKILIESSVAREALSVAQAEGEIAAVKYLRQQLKNDRVQLPLRELREVVGSLEYAGVGKKYACVIIL